MKDKTERTVKITRFYRKLHKWLAVPLFIFLFLIGSTGLMLGWKKQVKLLPATQSGTSIATQEWLSLKEIQDIASQFSIDSLQLSPTIDRIDIRPQKGVAKIVFEEHFTELQIDCKTGAILSVEVKTSDIIEKIHDGSIIDYYTRINQDPFKLIYTSLASTGLILLSISGFWMWYNPKRIKRLKQKR